MASYLSNGKMLGLCLAMTCIQELLVNLIAGKICNSSWVCFGNLTLNFITLSTTDSQYLLLNLLSKFIFYSPAAAAKSLQSCPTLCDPIDGSPPGSPVPGILQARTLEWVAISIPLLLSISQCMYIFCLLDYFIHFPSSILTSALEFFHVILYIAVRVIILKKCKWIMSILCSKPSKLSVLEAKFFQRTKPYVIYLFPPPFLTSFSVALPQTHSAPAILVHWPNQVLSHIKVSANTNAFSWISACIANYLISLRTLKKCLLL